MICLLSKLSCIYSVKWYRNGWKGKCKFPLASQLTCAAKYTNNATPYMK